MSIQMQSKDFLDSKDIRKDRTKTVQGNNNLDSDPNSLKCQECGSTIIKNSELGESCCSKCGLITQEKEIEKKGNKQL
ncbi:MAG: hypothetical protein EU529_14785 [Promethearchaeota archaeon]|nr:MAG: hypothetical protein EU529_14785 [Candidatus Lokiarchaeota archaeon]